MTHRQKTGQMGENEASVYLEKKKYKILERNYRKPWGEIDIIARNSEKALVFVEVKAMRTSELFALKPEDNLTSTKLRKVRRTAELYANSHPELVTKRGWQIDLVAIEIGEFGQEIRHYENI